MLLRVVGVGCRRPCNPALGGRHAPTTYPSDLSDQEWAILEPLLSTTERHGRPSGPHAGSRTPCSTC